MIRTSFYFTEILVMVVLIGCIQGALASRLKRQITTPIDTGIYQWTQWTHWSDCNATCSVNNGRGVQNRTRKCEDDGDRVKIVHCQVPYTGDEDDAPITDEENSHVVVKRASSINLSYYDLGYQICLAYCPNLNPVVNGGWSNWSDWTKCTTDRNPNYRVRARQCNSPQPANGGLDCVGDSSQIETCATNTWSDWSAYTACSATCGIGQRTRLRTCTTGNNCIGNSIEQTTCTVTSCAINGQWGAWSTYGECSATCGDGVQFRMRQCDSPAPVGGGHDCTGNGHEFLKCNTHECPIDGGWSTFTELPCSATCGLGVQTTFRTCTNPAPVNGGKNCTGSSHTFKHCNLAPCVQPIDGSWSNFTELACSTSCGLGVQVTFRKCTNPAPAYGGKNCTGSSHTFKQCLIAECAIDGGYANWGAWSKCSVTSGIGGKVRTRHCTAPAPKYGGHACVGATTETELCVSNKWSGWSAWSSCDATCGNATRSRTRTCDTGNDCTGDAIEMSTQCNTTVCYTDDAYTEWSNWADCTATCGQGISTRTRKCKSTYNDVHDCFGEFLEKRDCNMTHCPIDGGWSPYINQTCSVTCGTGTAIAIRACNSPAPEFGGKTCDGSYQKTSACEEVPCAIDGLWNDWSVWGTCDNTCGNGTKSRTRSCNNPAPQYGGQNCSGDGIETQTCFEVECPIDGGWSEYFRLPCSVTCGDGQQVALRDCDNPAPQFGGKYCVGISHQITMCHMSACSVDGGWSDWSVIGQCSSMCGDGHQLRSRTCTNPAPENGGNNCTGDANETIPCVSGPCPNDVPICNKTNVLQVLSDNHLYAPIRPGPCSNMDFIPQEAMIKDVCNAPDDVNLWAPSKDIRTICDSVPLYSPITMVHRAYSTKEYGVVLHCDNNKLKFVTETCDSGVHEVNVDLGQANATWDYFMTTW